MQRQDLILTDSSIRLRHVALFIFIILSWGLAWPVNKVGLEFMSPAWYTAIRLVIGTLTMMALVVAMKKFSLPDWRDMPLIVIVGLFQLGLYILLVNFGLAYMPAGRSSLLAYTTPLWVMPAAIILFAEPAGPLKWMGFILGISGLIILLSPWELNWSDRNILFGTAMLLLSSLIWAMTMLCVRHLRWHKSPLELMPWQLLVGTLPILAYAYMQEPTVTIHWNATLLLSLIYTGFLVTGLSYWSGIVVNRELPTIVVSLGFLAVPVFSLLVSAIYLHEPISLLTGIAMILILTGLACVAI